MKKVCSRCKQEKDLTEFYKSKKGKYGYYSYCKLCERKRRRSEERTEEYYEYHRSHSEKYRLKHSKEAVERTKLYQKKCFQQWMNLIIIPQGLNKCSKCGYDKCFHAIDFHHRDPKEKKFNIGSMLRTKITPENLEELAKCDPLCANCHREKEAGLW
jgi:hypothetical protein